MTRTLFALAVGATAIIVQPGCSTAPKSESDKSDLSSEVDSTLSKFRSANAPARSTLDSSVGYAVLPNVGKGAAVVGAAYGKGEVFEGGGRIGYCDMTQGSIGAQLGGQHFSEILVFTSREALDDFKDGSYSLSANASAVAADAGKTRAKDSGGVVVYVTDEKGLMAEASVGAQKFRYTPIGMASESSKSSSSSY